MGRSRKSTEALARNGAFDKNPQRARDRAAEPEPLDPIGPPPDSFIGQFGERPKLLEAWNEFMFEAKEVKLTSADRTAVEMICRLKVRTRSLNAKTGDFAQLHAYLAKFGLTPADRSRVQSRHKKSEAEEADEWGALKEGATGLHVQ